MNNESIIFTTAGVLTAGAFAEDHFNPASFSLYKRLWMIGALTLLLAITGDIAPEFAGPLALLILVSYLVHNGKYFGLATSENTKGAKK